MTAEMPRSFIVLLPNLISLGRLVLVPTIVLMIVEGSYAGAFFVFALAGIGDAVDGFIARQFDARSRIGALLDPLADKALLVSIYLSLSFMGEIPFWLTIFVVSRDFLIVGAVMLAWMVEKPIEVHPLVVSKANTAAQILLAAVVLGDLAFTVDFGWIRRVLVVTVAILTITSASAYLVGWVRHMSRP